MFYNDIPFHIIDNYTHTNFTPRLFSLQISMWPLPSHAYMPRLDTGNIAKLNPLYPPSGSTQFYLPCCDQHLPLYWVIWLPRRNFWVRRGWKSELSIVIWEKIWTMSTGSCLFCTLLSTAKQGDNGIGSVRPCVCLFVRAKSNKSHNQSKVFFCVSVISGHIWIIMELVASVRPCVCLSELRAIRVITSQRCLSVCL